MGMEAKDYERMATMEEQIKQMVQAVNGLTQKLDTWQNNYVPRQELGEMFRSRDEKIGALTTELATLRNEKNSGKGLWPAWAGVGVSVMAIAVSMIAIFTN